MRSFGISLPVFLLFAVTTEHGSSMRPHIVQPKEHGHWWRELGLNNAPSTRKQDPAEMLSFKCLTILDKLDLAIKAPNKRHTRHRIDVVKKIKHKQPQKYNLSDNELCLNIINHTLKNKIWFFIKQDLKRNRESSIDQSDDNYQKTKFNEPMMTKNMLELHRDAVVLNPEVVLL